MAVGIEPTVILLYVYVYMWKDSPDCYDSQVADAYQDTITLPSQKGVKPTIITAVEKPRNGKTRDGQSRLASNLIFELKRINLGFPWSVPEEISKHLLNMRPLSLEFLVKRTCLNIRKKWCYVWGFKKVLKASTWFSSQCQQADVCPRILISAYHGSNKINPFNMVEETRWRLVDWRWEDGYLPLVLSTLAVFWGVQKW